MLALLLCLLVAVGKPIPKIQATTELVPPFCGEPYVTLGTPNFSPEDRAAEAFERYSELDKLGRCGPALAKVGLETMPTEARGAIGMVRPSGWQLQKYDFIDGKYLFNRCHLIAYQLTGENANPQNLITGTRYLNTVGMLPFETEVIRYIRETGNHVLYRATPVFEGEELVARGVELEGLSVEDHGKGISFRIYLYNVQPGVEIDYTTGKSRAEEREAEEGESVAPAAPAEVTYVLNTRSRKFHRPDCRGVTDMSRKNRRDFTGSREEAIAQGFAPCGDCKP